MHWPYESFIDSSKDLLTGWNDKLSNKSTFCEHPSEINVYNKSKIIPPSDIDQADRNYS